MWRGAGAPRRNRVSLSEGFNGALVRLDTYFKPSKNGETEKVAGSALSHFFIWLCMHNMLDELIQYAGRELAETAITGSGSMVGMLPDLQDQPYTSTGGGLCVPSKRSKALKTVKYALECHYDSADTRPLC